MRAKKLLEVFLLLGCSASAVAQMVPPAAKTPGDALNTSLGIGGHDFVSAAGAMPADKYGFRPTR